MKIFLILIFCFVLSGCNEPAWPGDIKSIGIDNYQYACQEFRPGHYVDCKWEKI